MLTSYQAISVESISPLKDSSEKQRRKVYFITGLGASIEVQMGQERHNFTFIEPKIILKKNTEVEWMGLII